MADEGRRALKEFARLAEGGKAAWSGKAGQRADSRALAVWSDTRAGTPASSRQDLGRAVVAFSDPPRIAGGLKWLLIIGGIAAILAGAAVLVVGLVWPGARVPLARLRRRA